MILEMEWRSLSKELTEDEAKDGRRCFYCGALAILNEIKQWEIEIKKALSKSDDPEQPFGCAPDEA